ncbi:MAG: peptidoglycan bridge formation glycyltransferase FemA/FemB family protein [Nitrospiraceae bacterium]|nr:peptidoglycan bridge formation glycyltransferase FemA/FemB family protein [Nitrospiraceae bacterium]
MSVIENSKWHPMDQWYNQDILSKLSEYRNMRTFVEENNPIFLHKLKYFPLKLKAFMPRINKHNLQRIINFAADRGVPVLELVTYIDQHADLSNYNASISYSGTYVINLTTPLEELSKNLNGKRRNQIRKATKEGVTVDITFNRTLFEKWWKIYIETSQRGKFVPQKKELILDLLLSKCCKLFTAWASDLLLAGNIIVANNYPFWWLGASSRGYAKYNAPSLLQWKIIEWAKEQNYPCYDLGGAALDANHGPTRFKKQFGGELKKYIRYEIYIKPYRAKLIEYFKNVYYQQLKRPTF